MLYSIKPIVNHNNDKTMFNTASTAAMNVSSMTPIEYTLKKCNIKFTKKVLVKENDSELAFLEANDTVDVVNQLKFDILKDVYLTMREESKADLEAINKKEFKQKVLNIIANKKDDALINKSIDELEALIKD